MNEPGHTLHREYRDLYRRLEQAQFKVMTTNPDNLPLVKLVMTITDEIQKLNFFREPPDISGPMATLLKFQMQVLPYQLGGIRWKKVVRVLTLARNWLFADIIKELAASRESSRRS